MSENLIWASVPDVDRTLNVKRRIMKLFIFEEVLCDYSCGMIVIVAENLLTAKLLILNQINYSFESLDDFDDNNIQEYDLTTLETSQTNQILALVKGGG